MVQTPQTLVLEPDASVVHSSASPASLVDQDVSVRWGGGSPAPSSYLHSYRWATQRASAACVSGGDVSG